MCTKTRYFPNLEARKRFSRHNNTFKNENRKIRKKKNKKKHFRTKGENIPLFDSVRLLAPLSHFSEPIQFRPEKTVLPY